MPRRRHRRLALAALALLVCPAASAHAASAIPVFTVRNEPVAAPDGPLAPDAPANKAWLADTTVQVRLGDFPPHTLDTQASPDCPPALATFVDGSALAVWRGRAADDTQDLLHARFVDGVWETPAPLHRDDWRAPAVPAGEGPALDARGPHVAVAWFTAPDGDPRIQLSTSSNAGVQWLLPARIDDVRPLGRVSLVLLDDGAQLVSWVERPGSEYVILLRRISARGTPSPPVELARLATDPGHPGLVRVKDADATGPAQLRLSYLENTRHVARLLTLPDPRRLAESDICDCDPRPEDQRGYPLAGKITAIDSDAATVTVQHAAIPGVLGAATTAFKVSPEVLAHAQVDQRLLARVEKHGPDWHLFAPRQLKGPPPAR